MHSEGVDSVDPVDPVAPFDAFDPFLPPRQHGQQADIVQLPSSTVWPLVLALGVGLLGASLVTHWTIGLLGVLLMLPAIVGWFRQVLPHEHHEPVHVITEVIHISSLRTSVAHMPGLAPTLAHAPVAGGQRKILPVETYTIWAGVKGGLAGGIAMTVPATLFSLIRYHSLWYSINLLAAGGFVSWAHESDAFLAAFHLEGLLAAVAIHFTTSLLVGLLYGAMLPMFPYKPILTAGFIAPLFWTGLLYTVLGVVSPILDQRIDWLWFIASQVAFGLVAGFVVNLQVKVRTAQFRALPFAMRAGFETARSDEDSSMEDQPK